MSSKRLTLQGSRQRESNLAEIRAHLADTLGPLIPFRIVDHLADPAAALQITVYFQFTEISNEIAGQPLASGMVAANFEVFVVVPQKVSAEGEDQADIAVLNMVQALEASEDLFWGPSAVKLALTTGELAWSIPVSVLTSTVPVKTNY